MITSVKEYEQFLRQVNESTPAVLKLRLPTTESIYEIDWNSRLVEAPKYLGVEGDHESETIYFKMARYYETMDLVDTIGLISFKNAHGDEYWYIIPYYDIYSIPDYIVFPWVIQYPIAAFSGTVQFAFKFIKIDKTVTANNGQALIYELNSRVATSSVLAGWANADYTQTHLYTTIDPNQVLVTNEYIRGLNTIIQAGEQLQIYWQDVGERST